MRLSTSCFALLVALMASTNAGERLCIDCVSKMPSTSTVNPYARTPRAANKIENPNGGAIQAQLSAEQITSIMNNCLSDPECARSVEGLRIYACKTGKERTGVMPPKCLIPLTPHAHK